MAIIKGSEALIELLRHEGVEYVFGLPGSSELEFMDDLEDTPEIKYVLGLQESIVVAMAEGYSRTSGKVGVVNLHTCAGLSSAMGIAGQRVERPEELSAVLKSAFESRKPNLVEVWLEEKF